MKINISVAGQCPACGKSLLFVTADGYVKCSARDCPDPGAPSAALISGGKSTPLSWEEKFRRLTVHYDQRERDYKNLEKEIERLYVENHRLSDAERKSAPHLQYWVSDRGFLQLTDIPGSYGGRVRVYESSNAEHPHIWLNAEAPKDLNKPSGEMVQAPLHLTVESAKALAEQLLFLVDQQDEDECYESTCGCDDE